MISAISGDSSKELERAPSFATTLNVRHTENISQTVIINPEFVAIVILSPLFS